MVSPIIVYDSALPQFLNNRIFDQEYAARFPGALAVAHLQHVAVQRGWQMMTADVFLETERAVDLAVCMSEMVTPRTEHLLKRGVIPAVLTCGESPNVAWRFYHHLPTYTRRFRHAFLFRGTSSRVKPPTQFHPLYWPNARRDVLPGRKWAERELLVMVVSNKDRFQVSRDKPLLTVRRFAKRYLRSYLQVIDPLFRFKDLYKERLEAICYFADRPGFWLFGMGWDQPRGLAKRYFLAAQQAGANPVDDKLQAMSGFKFALCFENCVFPGYVTEKIFDCFFAGCVPIYYGSPDITDFVPAETFIDFRRFASFAELDRYLQSLSEAKARRYIEAARNFLASQAFDKYYVDTLAQEMMNILEQELQSVSN